MTKVLSKKFLIINGPNLNMLGKREPSIYGDETLVQLQEHTERLLSEHNVQLEWLQSNIEGELINHIHQACAANYQAVIINPGAYGHTSVALLDALKCLEIPVVEVHLTNTHRREEFRQVKLTAKASTTIMEGLGRNSYYFAVLSQLI